MYMLDSSQQSMYHGDISESVSEYMLFFRPRDHHKKIFYLKE